MDQLIGLFDPGMGSTDVMPESLPPEIEEGNVEYKLKLVNPSESRFEHLVTQMKWRLQEGQGEAIYEIGVEDNGLLAGLTLDEMAGSLNTLQKMAAKLGADITTLREKHVDSIGAGPLKMVAEVLVRKVPENQQFIDLRLAVLGNVDAGKSTLLGVLTQGELDNGRGRARLNLFRHLHEIQSGRTSSISHEILGFNSDGEVVNYSESRTAEDICENSTKLITLIDLCGHHKYLKTTIFGLTGYSPDFAMLVVSANTGIVGTTKEHLGFALALGVPIFAVVSKIDMCSSTQVEKTTKQLEKLLKSPGVKKVPFRVEGEDDAVTAASTFHTDSSLNIGLELSKSNQQLHAALEHVSSMGSLEEEQGMKSKGAEVQGSRSLGEGISGLLQGGAGQVVGMKTPSNPSICHSICPIFAVSSVTGGNLDLLTTFLNVLPPLHNSKEMEKFMQEHAEHQIDVVYSVPGVGVVPGGTLVRGTIKEGDSLLLGPTDDGHFDPVQVSTIHRNRLPCRVVTVGQAACLSFDQDKPHIRKGMVLVSPALHPVSCVEFEAEVYLLFHTTYICKGFQTVIHVGNVCQTAKIIHMNKSCIHTNEKATVIFRFINRPEYVKVGSRLLFREGRTKGMGEITKIFAFESLTR